MDPISIALGLAQVAPSLIKWIAGDDAAQVAQKVVDVAKGVTGKTTGDDALSAINADPQSAQAFKQAWLEHEAAMYAAATERLKVELADVDSARKRQIELKDKVPGILAVFLTVGFFGLLGWLVGHAPPDGSRDILNIMLGSLGTGWITMLAYYFGSSKDSARQTQWLARSGPVK